MTSIRTDELTGMACDVIKIAGHGGDQVRAYTAQPQGAGPFPGVVVIHHAPGWDEWTWEATQRFAQHGYLAIAPNLYERVGHGTPEEVAAIARSAGGVPDVQAVGDIKSSMDWLRAQSSSSGKVALFGTCSAGRHAFLAACRLGDEVDAVVECWGGRIIQAPEALSEKQPVSPNTLTPQLRAPLLGIFGNDDQGPSPAQVDQHEAELKQAGKRYEFHRYDGAGHGFMSYDRPNYRQEQSVDAWNRVLDFLSSSLS